MKINTDKIRALKPCLDRFNNYLNHYQDFDGSLEDFVMLENITYSDKVWVFIRLATKMQNVKWSLLCASKVLHIFEEKYPDNKKPRLALEAAENWINNPNDDTANAAYAAASAANAAAYAANAAAYAAASAAYAANARKNEEELNLLMMVEAVNGEKL